MGSLPVIVAVAGVPVLPILLVAVCVIVFVLALLRPVRSITAQHRLQAWIDRRRGAAVDNPVKSVGTVVTPPLDGSQVAINKSAGTARSLRSRLPF